MARSTGQAGLAVVEKGKELNTQYGVAEKVSNCCLLALTNVETPLNVRVEAFRISLSILHRRS